MLPMFRLEFTCENKLISEVTEKTEIGLTD